MPMAPRSRSPRPRRAAPAAVADPAGNNAEAAGIAVAAGSGNEGVAIPPGGAAPAGSEGLAVPDRGPEGPEGPAAVDGGPEGVAIPPEGAAPAGSEGVVVPAARGPDGAAGPAAVGGGSSEAMDIVAAPVAAAPPVAAPPVPAPLAGQAGDAPAAGNMQIAQTTGAQAGRTAWPVQVNVCARMLLSQRLRGSTGPPLWEHISCYEGERFMWASEGDALVMVGRRLLWLQLSRHGSVLTLRTSSDNLVFQLGAV